MSTPERSENIKKINFKQEQKFQIFMKPHLERNSKRRIQCLISSWAPLHCCATRTVQYFVVFSRFSLIFQLRCEYSFNCYYLNYWISMFVLIIM